MDDSEAIAAVVVLGGCTANQSEARRAKNSSSKMNCIKRKGRNGRPRTQNYAAVKQNKIIRFLIFPPVYRATCPF